MILKFMFKGAWNENVATNRGYAENHFLVVDPETRTFKYWVNAWEGDDTFIKVKKNDLLRIMSAAEHDGYALKIGG